MARRHGKGIRRGRKATRCKDRLSLLPEHILIDIISLLPFKSVIATSVLSHQWRYLWTQITSFNVPYNMNILEVPCYDEKFRQLTSPSIHTLQLYCHLHLLTKSVLDSWIINVCARNVKIMKLDLLIRDWELPHCVFLTKTLVELHIKCLRTFSLPCRTNLPKLKKLSIKGLCPLFMPSIDPSSITLFDKFINSCPLLEELYFELDALEYSKSEFNFMVRNLKRLSMQLDNFSCKIVIDAPHLESLAFNGPVKFHFAEIPNVLLEELRRNKGDNIQVQNTVELISHSVKHLETNYIPLGPIEGLSNLTCLQFEFTAMDFEKLMKFLQVGPALKVLRLRINLCMSSNTLAWRWDEWCLWRLPQFQTNVDKIELEIKHGDLVFGHKQHLIYLVKFLLLSLSNDLKQFTFVISYYFSRDFSTFERNLVKCLRRVRKERSYEIYHSTRKRYWSFIAWF